MDVWAGAGRQEYGGGNVVFVRTFNMGGGGTRVRLGGRDGRSMCRECGWG